MRLTALYMIAALTLMGCSTHGGKDEYDKLDAAQIFSKGRHHLKAGRYAQAVEDFDALEARFPYGEYADKAQLAVIYAYFENQEPESALASAERFIQIHPRHAHVDYAYYMKGLIKFSESLTGIDRYLPLNPGERDISSARDAFFHFDELIQRFPKSEYASDARQRMVYLKNVLAEHDVMVAKHYMKRKAYVAALNRSIHLTEQFADTPWNKEAWSIRRDAYKAMGLNDLAAEANEVLKANP